VPELRRLCGYVVPYWPRLSGALIGLLLSSAITLALPYAIRLLVDSVFLNRDFRQLNGISLGLLLLFVIQALVSFSYRYLLQYVAQRAVADLRLDLHRHLLRLPLRFFTNRRVGDIVSRASSDAAVLQEVLVSVPVSLMRQIFTFGGGVVLMLVMNWQLTLVVLATIPPIVLVSAIYGRRLKQLSTDVQDRLADATVVLEEMLSGVRVVKTFTREAYEQERYTNAIEQSFATSLERTRQRAMFAPLITLLGFGALTVLIWYGGRQVINDMITPGELIAFLFYMILVAAPMAESANLWGRIQEAVGASRRIFEILDTPPELTRVTSPLRSAETAGTNGFSAPHTRLTAAGHVRFVDVSFRYTDVDADDELPIVLQHIHLDAHPGQVVALVGYSGSGKTTLVNLIPRFYEPTAGRIELDGVDIRHLGLPALRAQIGLVPQETFLFGGSVRENIAYGRLDASDEEIRAAATAAYAHNFIAALPRQYDTIVGERGVKLSAGQRQRIAIARALLKNPRILILDEATSALDTESERWVQAALERLMEGRTSFVIAHRLSTIQRADTILAIEQGRIVERGSHAELLTRNGLYRKLYDMQFAVDRMVA